MPKDLDPGAKMGCLIFDGRILYQWKFIAGIILYGGFSKPCLIAILGKRKDRKQMAGHADVTLKKSGTTPSLS